MFTNKRKERMKKIASYFILLVVLCMGYSCSQDTFTDPDWSDARDSLSLNNDSIIIQQGSFALTHHYDIGFNFQVRTDTMVLLTDIQQPSGLLFTSPDSIPLNEEDQILVAEIVKMPADTEDSIWVKLVRDAECIGWARENYLLRNVTPSDPISVAIMFFSEVHMDVTILFAIVFAVLMAMRIVSFRRHCSRWPGKHSFLNYMPLPHLNDICSPYPLLLYLTLAGSAVFYSTMQLYAFQTWQHFYFHPTLNPFAVPWVLGAFLFSLWLMLIFFIATVIDMVRQLYFYRLCMYICSMLALMAVLYVFFSVTTLYHVGYLIYPLYVGISVWYYWKHTRPRYSCGNCGIPMHSLGQCPHCRYINE